MGARQEKKGADLNEKISHHMNIITRCTVESKLYGKLLLATPPDTRYPYIYPRDASAAVIVLRRIACSPHGYDVAPESYQLIESIANFMKDAAGKFGGWGQRFSTQGEDKSIYRQEDNMAHGLAILCNYLITAHKLQKEVENLEEFLNCINEGAAWSLQHLYQKELNLFHSTTAIHESALEEGYTCWVNFSFLYAFSLVQEVADLMDNKEMISRSHLDFRKHFLHSVSELFISGGRYIRRIDSEGRLDLRPDFTLLAPFYYGFAHYQQALQNAVDYLEKQLWDPELGMIMRYLPFHKDFATHLHAGNGPWLQYTAVLAQFHYWRGNTKGGDELLSLIDQYASVDGEIPEHLSTCKRFEHFMETEWKAGIDFAKEFHRPILLPQVEFDKILEEANNMQHTYNRIAQGCMYRDPSRREGGYIHFARPLMWSHVEYIRALLMRAGDWWPLLKGKEPKSP